MNKNRKLSLRRESLSELTRHELQGVAGGDAVGCLSCNWCDTWVTCGGATIATCECPTGGTCVCPTATCGCV